MPEGDRLWSGQALSAPRARDAPLGPQAGGVPLWLAGSGILHPWPGWGSLWQRGSPGPREWDRQGWACAQGCAGYGVRGAGPGAQGALLPHSLGSHRSSLWRCGSSRRAPRGARGQRPPGGFQEGAQMCPRPRAGVWGCVSGPRTCSSPGGALSPGPPASCSLCSRAASSPTGLRGARPSSCSYSTHRLLSVSLAAGDPAGAQTSPAEPTGAREAGGEGAGQAPSGTQPRPAVSPGHTYPWVSASGWGRARPDSWPSWWRGAQATRPPRQQRLPHPNLGQQAGGRAQASGQSQGGWVLHRPFPAGRRAQGAASWARRTHSVLSHTEELGHVADDRAEVVVHPDVGAHPGGQLGPGVHVGEPGGRRLSARGPTPPSPQPQLPLAERRTSTRLAPARLSTRVSVSRGEPHLWSQRKMAP